MQWIWLFLACDTSKLLFTCVCDVPAQSELAYLAEEYAACGEDVVQAEQQTEDYCESEGTPCSCVCSPENRPCEEY